MGGFDDPLNGAALSREFFTNPVRLKVYLSAVLQGSLWFLTDITVRSSVINFAVQTRTTLMVVYSPQACT